MRQLEQFYEVCREGSFKGAGDKLFMTQQAIGKSMRSLEAELGVKLFVRQRYGVRLTQQGEFLREQGTTILNYYDDLKNQIRAIDQDLS